MISARPMTVMMPNGTRTMPIPEPSTAASGSLVELKLVSLAAIVKVISVVLDVILSLSILASVVNGRREMLGGLEVLGVLERKLAVVLTVVRSMLLTDRKL